MKKTWKDHEGRIAAFTAAACAAAGLSYVQIGQPSERDVHVATGVLAAIAIVLAVAPFASQPKAGANALYKATNAVLDWIFASRWIALIAGSFAAGMSLESDTHAAAFYLTFPALLGIGAIGALGRFIWQRLVRR